MRPRQPRIARWLAWRALTILFDAVGAEAAHVYDEGQIKHVYPASASGLPSTWGALGAIARATTYRCHTVNLPVLECALIVSDPTPFVNVVRPHFGYPEV